MSYGPEQMSQRFAFLYANSWPHTVTGGPCYRTFFSPFSMSLFLFLQAYLLFLFFFK